MKKSKFGSMVHISSVDALSGDDKPQDAYGASKAAMIRLSKSLAIQFAPYNIRSNIILPGSIDTPMQDRWEKNPKAKKELSKLIPLKRSRSARKASSLSDNIPSERRLPESTCSSSQARKLQTAVASRIWQFLLPWISILFLHSGTLKMK